jgi:hypothetical protein
MQTFYQAVATSYSLLRYLEPIGIVRLMYFESRTPTDLRGNGDMRYDQRTHPT